MNSDEAMDAILTIMAINSDVMIIWSEITHMNID